MTQPHESRLASALLVQTVATGLIDAVSSLALGHVFTANMTGNVRGVIHVPRRRWVAGGENWRRAARCRQPTSGRRAIPRWSG